MAFIRIFLGHFLTSFFFFVACTQTEAPENPDPVVAESETPAPSTPVETAAQSEAQTPEATPLPTPVSASPQPPTSVDCKVLAGFPGDEPVFIKSAGVMLTRVASPCLTPDGQSGHLPTGGWMAMGFPCTGGEGRIDWKGTNYNLPKMVTFLLDTSCAMAPHDPVQLKQLVAKEAGLPPTAPVIAFNPFVVQYWEVVGFDDADASFSVDLRQNKSLSANGWGQFIKQKPLKVLLIGRENAWVPGNHMYAVDGELHWASKNRFTMKVLDARVLKGDELNAIKTRCEALRPERECGKVF